MLKHTVLVFSFRHSAVSWASSFCQAVIPERRTGKRKKTERKKNMAFTRKQFDILETLIEKGEALSQRELEKITGHSLGVVNRIVRELTEAGFISEGRVTNEGINAMEPYRARRAVFIAAGFGTRLVPITFNTPKPLVRVHGVRIIDHLIDACLAAGINEIIIVRGYLGELFDQLLYKYPMIKFLENPLYNEANNISSALVARYMLSNAYVFEADLLISNPAIIKKYHYTSDFLAIKKDRSDDWCFRVKDGIIQEEKVGGEGPDIWQMVGISYWNEADGHKLSQDIQEIYQSPGGKERYWEQVPLVYAKEHY
ncbi:MAG: winged helix-turn-helix transcriptional regulator, partial [Lachnospiraceae bacterium]|nr:winged helix-turn-helix transcriptional regulator [Lachnospiraceae bacterium]